MIGDDVDEVGGAAGRNSGADRRPFSEEQRPLREGQIPGKGKPEVQAKNLTFKAPSEGLECPSSLILYVSN